MLEHLGHSLTLIPVAGVGRGGGGGAISANTATMVATTSAGPVTWNAGTGTTGAFYLEPEYLRHPIGKQLSCQPQPGMWIQENTVGSRRRQIIGVEPGKHLICKGKRHSLVAWHNLHRYIEVPDQRMKYFGE